MDFKNVNNIIDFYNILMSKNDNYFIDSIIKKKKDGYKVRKENLKYFLCSIKPIVRLALKYKFKHNKIVLGNSLFDYANNVYNNKDNYCKLFNLLEDNESKQTLLNILSYRVSYDRDYLDSCVRPVQDQYLDSKIMKFKEDEVIVDCGSFIGDNALSYFKYMKKVKKYYLIEPDENNILISKRILNNENFENIEYIQCATGKENKEFRFVSGTSGGTYISQEGDKIISISRIDDLIKEPATFIKMDIEGEEASTLEGAIEQIKNNKPKLAVCAYHKPNDLINLTNLVLSIRNDYKVFLRLYFSGFCEAVLYFI